MFQTSQLDTVFGFFFFQVTSVNLQNGNAPQFLREKNLFPQLISLERERESSGDLSKCAELWKLLSLGQSTLHSGALRSLHGAEGSTIRPAGSDHKDSLCAEPHPATWGTYPRGWGTWKQLDTDSATSCSSPEASAHADSLTKQPLR